MLQIHKRDAVNSIRVGLTVKQTVLAVRMYIVRLDVKSTP
jgi:hypothetical protein